MRNFIIAIFTFLSINGVCQVDTQSNLSDTEKIWGLTNFYTEVKYNFAFFDQTPVNWDSAYNAFLPKVLATKSTWEYYQELKQFCALLKDGHTNIYEPSSLYKSLRYKQLAIEFIDDKFFITNARNSKSAKDLLGAEVLTINGKPSLDWVTENILPYISASTTHQLWNDAAYSLFYSTDSTDTWNLELKTLKGKTINYSNTNWHTYRTDWQRAYPEWKRFEFKKIGNTGYVGLNTFSDPEIIEDFKKVVNELHTCSNIIIDIRNNGGGDSGIGAEILKYFTDQEIITGSVWKTRMHLPSYKAWGTFVMKEKQDADPDSLDEWERKCYEVVKGDHWYVGDTMSFENNIKEKRLDQPLVVLFGNNTASAAEDFLVMLSQIPGRAITIGQKSFGSTGQPLFMEMPGGGSARICTKRDTYPDGREFVGYGIVPDVEVKRNIHDIINGKDMELELALKELKSVPKTAENKKSRQ